MKSNKKIIIIVLN